MIGVPVIDGGAIFNSLVIWTSLLPKSIVSSGWQNSGSRTGMNLTAIKNVEIGEKSKMNRGELRNDKDIK